MGARFDAFTPMRSFFALSFAALLVAPLIAQSPASKTGSIERSTFGKTPEGVVVEQFTLTNTRGAVAKVITYGAIMTDLQMPDRAGKRVSVVREITASEQGFQRGFPQSAAVFGRVANRIAHGKFTLDGRDHQVTTNAGAHHIHGGRTNFSKVVWRPSVPAVSPAPSVELTYESADGEEGFPGKLTATITYTLTSDNTLRLEYRATSDKPTPINLTNHAYFNLRGEGDVLDHEIMINADRYTAADADLIPSGEIKSLKGTALDFTRTTALGARADQLGKNPRYDHNFVLNRPEGETPLQFAARARDPRSGRTMEVWTTEPGVQLYTSLLGPLAPNEKAPRFGFYCFETQHFPDSVNHPNFPSTILRPGQTFRSTTEFRFSAK
jgi:aldose 1-epimerase